MSGRSTATSPKNKNRNRNRRPRRGHGGSSSSSSGSSDRGNQEHHATRSKRSPKGGDSQASNQDNALRRISRRGNDGIQSPFPTNIGGNNDDTNPTDKVDANTLPRSEGDNRGNGNQPPKPWHQQRRREQNQKGSSSAPPKTQQGNRFQQWRRGIAQTWNLRSAGKGPAKIPKNLIPTSLQTDLVGADDHVASSEGSSPESNQSSDSDPTGRPKDSIFLKTVLR